MYIEDQEELRERWFGLIVHVVRKEFPWIIFDTGNGRHEKIRRSIDKADMYQEGWVALAKANVLYDAAHPTQSGFKTYAYQVILNNLKNFADDSCTPISIARSRQVFKVGSEELKHKLVRAMSYMVFSDVGSGEGDEEAVNAVVSRYDADPVAEVEAADFQEYCLSTLKREMDPLDYQILMLRFHGETYQSICWTIGRSREYVRKRFEALNYIVRHILFKEIEELSDDHPPNETDKSLAVQA